METTSHNVEIYPGEIITHVGVEGGHSRLMIGIYKFTREIFQPIQGPDQLMLQLKDFQEWYAVDVDTSSR